MVKWIVLVDDDQDMHYLYLKVFQRLGLANVVRAFENGHDALQFLLTHGHEVSIIFSDVNMPVMDGLELRRAINRSNAECRSIPFIFFSTSARESEIREARELAVQGFFQKGLTLQDIDKSIRIALGYRAKCGVPEFSPEML